MGVPGQLSIGPQCPAHTAESCFCDVQKEFATEELGRLEKRIAGVKISIVPAIEVFPLMTHHLRLRGPLL